MSSLSVLQLKRLYIPLQNWFLIQSLPHFEFKKFVTKPTGKAVTYSNFFLENQDSESMRVAQLHIFGPFERSLLIYCLRPGIIRNYLQNRKQNIRRLPVTEADWWIAAVGKVILGDCKPAKHPQIKILLGKHVSFLS